MNIWQYQWAISRRLDRWGKLSVGVGLLLRLLPFGKKWKSLGNQFAGWGMVNMGIALFGTTSARQRVDQHENPGKSDVKAQEIRGLSRLLWINAGLDVLYVLGGWLWSRRDKGDGKAAGSGYGVIVQGVFLLLFDIYHALNMPDKNE